MIYRGWFLVLLRLTSHFAHRGRKDFRLLMLSMISAALLTGAKTSNAPLLLAWLILFSGSFRLGLSRPVAFIFFALCGLVISFVPTALLNVKYCGDWTGFVLERAGLVKDPITGIAGNAFGLMVENIVPPIFPLAGWWNSHVIESMPPQLHHQHILKSFEALYGHVWELQQEEDRRPRICDHAVNLRLFDVEILGGRAPTHPKNDALLKRLFGGPWWLPRGFPCWHICREPEFILPPEYCYHTILFCSLRF